jgi:hypothetical protein
VPVHLDISLPLVKRPVIPPSEGYFVPKSELCVHDRALECPNLL